VELWTRRGQVVKTVAEGRVLFAGLIRGLGGAVIIDHGEYYSVLGRLTKLKVKIGQTLVRGAELGVAEKKKVYFEVRVPGGVGGIPIDPSRLLQRP